MSNNVPAGWYPDPSGAPQSRWWDGSQWQEATQAPAASVSAAPYSADPYSAAPYSATPYTAAGPAAFQGGSTDTWQVWAINGLFALQLIVTLVYIATVDWNAYLAWSISADPTDMTGLASVFSGWYLATLLVSFLGYVLSLLFARGDGKELERRGVQRPFHWAWNFIPSYGSTVYMIGRSVVVKRRTGRGLGPLWAFIAIVVIGTILTLVVSFAAMGSMMTEMSNLYPSSY